MQEAPTATPAPGPELPTLVRRDATVRFRGADWTVVIEASSDPAIGDCFSVTDTHRTERRIEAKLALNHPFLRRWVGPAADEIEPFLRIAAALALAEVSASMGGVAMAGTVRRNLNELLSSAFVEWQDD